MELPESGLICHPDWVTEEAEEIAKFRFKKNYDLRQTDKKYNSTGGEEMNWRIEFSGAMGEMVFKYFLEINDIRFDFTEPMAKNPQKKPDFFIRYNGMRIDAKASGNKGKNDILYPFYYIPEYKHLSVKGISHYAMIHLLPNNLSTYWIVAIEDVDRWPKKIWKDGSISYFHEFIRIGDFK